MTDRSTDETYSAARPPDHAFDPEARPDLFARVVRRRALAFLVDAAIILALTVLAYAVLAIVGVLTLGLGWLLLPAAFPAVALGYSAYTLRPPHSATIGMRLMGLEMRLWHGDRMSALLGAFHALVFYFSVSILTPLVLVVPFFNARKRCLHDFLSGAVVLDADRLAAGPAQAPGQ